MAKQNKKPTEKNQPKPSNQPAGAAPTFLFTRENYLYLGAGLVLIAIGFVLMTGGQQPPTQFDPKVIYGFTRITLSTIVVTIGFIVALLSIFRKPKNQ